MPVRSIVVTGVSGSVGQRLLTLLTPHVVDRVIGIDVQPSTLQPPNLEFTTADVSTTGLGTLFAGAEAVANLAWSLVPPREAERLANVNLEATRRVLAAADAAGVRTLVHLSSATVYGAWPDNPLPLTEEAPLRPNPSMLDAVHHAEAERLVWEWADAHPGAAVAVLRPATILGAGIDSWLLRALGGLPLRSDETDPARQFVHVDDVASAVALAARERLDGAYNVAADGWLSGDIVRGLGAGHPSLPVPDRLASVVTGWAWSLRLSSLPPGLLPLVEQPWVVANDRLRAAGWVPLHSNEDAIVAGRPPSRWREMSPSRRQEVALTGSAVLVGAAVAVTGAVAGALRRRRRRASA